MCHTLNVHVTKIVVQIISLPQLFSRGPRLCSGFNSNEADIGRRSSSDARNSQGRPTRLRVLQRSRIQPLSRDAFGNLNARCTSHFSLEDHGTLSQRYDGVLADAFVLNL